MNNSASSLPAGPAPRSLTVFSSRLAACGLTAALLAGVTASAARAQDQAAPAGALAALAPASLSTADKLGVGLYGGIPFDAMRSFRPAMMLVQDPDPNNTRSLRQMFPNALIVGRHFVPDGDASLAQCGNAQEDHHARGVAFADSLAATAVPLKGVVNAWVSDNEQATGQHPEDYACHAQFQAGFVERLQGTYGIDAVAGNDAPGALDPADYARYFAKPIGEAAYFGVHAYGKPGAQTLQTDDAAHYALRYRQIHDALVSAGARLPRKGFLLTETGLYDGWRGSVPDDKMAADFIWLEQQTEQDAYVAGQFIYGFGMGSRFGAFELQGSSLADQLGAFNAAHAGVPSTPPPASDPGQTTTQPQPSAGPLPDGGTSTDEPGRTTRRRRVYPSPAPLPLPVAGSGVTYNVGPMRPTETQDENVWVHGYLSQHPDLYALLASVSNPESGYIVDQLLNWRDAGGSGSFTPLSVPVGSAQAGGWVPGLPGQNSAGNLAAYQYLRAHPDLYAQFNAQTAQGRNAIIMQLAGSAAASPSPQPSASARAYPR